MSNNYLKTTHDFYGNPRVIVHFFEFLKEEDKSLENYKLAHTRAKSLGGRKYTGKLFGGGFVFQGYEDEIKKRIKEKFLSQ